MEILSCWTAFYLQFEGPLEAVSFFQWFDLIVLCMLQCTDVEVPFAFALPLAEGNHCIVTVVRETTKAENTHWLGVSL